ncbi:MAG: ComF family protein [Saccharofermentanales bacterium]
MQVNSFSKILGIHHVRQCAGIVSELVFPDICSFCGRNISGTTDINGVCRFCAAHLPLRSSVGIYERCIEDRLLLKLRYRLNDNFPVIVSCYYKNPIKKALLEMKFYEAAHYREAFGSIMALTLGLTGKSFDCIIPIPLHEKRQKERGYNQAALIAECLSSETGIPVITECLIRNKYTRRQSETKSREQRIDNLAGVFLCVKPECAAGKNVLILDDVLTSGATIFNAARSIREAVRHYEKTENGNEDTMNVTGITLVSDR